jgi:uncharacterized protein YecE (DUF72 family)
VGNGGTRREGTPDVGIASLRIGCSGWQYRSWRGRFYPADLPMSQWLDFYTGTFDTVEINNTF